MFDKNLLSIEQLNKQEILGIFELAKEMKNHLKKGELLETLKGKTVATLFYENSTRTKTSFALACKYLGATTVDLGISTSSVQKGESIIDTVLTLQALKTDAVVIRHQTSGIHEYLSKNVECSVINAGDGCHSHPTQALLDGFTMFEQFGSLNNLKVAIIGDLKHSRVFRSNVVLLNKFGVKPFVFAPKTLMPCAVEQLDVVACENLQQAMENADVVMCLRIQLERQEKGMFPSIREYAKFYGVNLDNIKNAKPDAVIMHPAPVNRGVELTHDSVDCEQSLINEQVTNGLCVRMAVLQKLLSDKN